MTTNQLTVISENVLRKSAPAAFARSGARHLSKKYVPLPTIDAVRALNKDGYVVTEAKQDRGLKRDPKFIRHAVVLMRRGDLQRKAVVGGVALRLIIINSANGTKPLVIRVGLYRFVCANGLVVGTTFAGARHKHIYVDAREVIERARQLSKVGQKAITNAQKWSKVKMTERQQMAFAKAALYERFGNKAAQYAPEQLLIVLRPEDKGNDLWKVFNRVQENASRGNFQGRNADGRATRARRLNGITQDIGFNAALWQLAEKVAVRA